MSSRSSTTAASARSRMYILPTRSGITYFSTSFQMTSMVERAVFSASVRRTISTVSMRAPPTAAHRRVDFDGSRRLVIVPARCLVKGFVVHSLPDHEVLEGLADVRVHILHRLVAKSFLAGNLDTGVVIGAVHPLAQRLGARRDNERRLPGHPEHGERAGHGLAA